MKKIKNKFSSGMFFAALTFLMLLSCDFKSQCLAPNNWDVTSRNASNNTQSYDIARDSHGDIYVCGTFESAATFTGTCSGGPPVNVTIFGSGSTAKSAYIAKFDCGGKLLWVNFESNSGWSEGRTLVIDPASNYVFLAGASNGSLSFRTTGFTPCTSGLNSTPFSTTQYFVARFNTSNGAFVDGYGPTPTGGTSYQINSMALKKMVTGSITKYDLFLCGSALFGAAPDQNFIIHTVELSSTSGYSLLWSHCALCVGGFINQVWDIEYNPVSDLVFFTGDFNREMTYPLGGTTVYTWTKTAMVDGFIGAVDPGSGTPYLIHCKNLGAAAGEYGTGKALTVDGGGDMYYTGSFTGSLTSLYGSATALAGAPGRYAMFVTRRNSTPSMVWRNRILPVSTGNCVGMGIAINTSSVYVSGSFDGGNLFFPGGGGTYTSPGKRMFIATFNRTTQALLSGNTSKSSDPNSDHLTEKVTCDNDFVYTCGSYKGVFDYTTGSPPWGVLNSTPALTNQNAFVVRNGTGATNPFRFANIENNGKSVAETKIFPNPTNGLVSIKMNEELLDSEITIEVHDINGRLLYSENKIYHSNTTVDINEFDSGLYIINIKGNNTNYYQKIIKE